MTPRDSVVFRPLQRSMITSVLNAIERGDRTWMGDIHPGSGKTLGSQAAINAAYRAGIIDAAAVFTPRLNLCQQYELDWNEFRPLFAEPSMGPLVHRDNAVPLIRGNQFGYVSTYQGLTSQPAIHLDVFSKYKGRIMLVADEAQLLGSDLEGGTGTQSARYIAELADMARFVMVMSGTPYRSDGRPLLFGKYSDPDANGVRYLEPDVRATYMEGVKEGYLRRFEYELFDGQALYEYLDGDVDALVLSKMSSGLQKVVRHPGFWHPAVDRTVEAVREVQAIDRRLCGLIGASDQSHAKQIIKYLNDRHGVSALLAVSDERLAQDNLRKFKQGGVDILVTVAMAHMGYDYKPISVVTCLNGFRQIGWLDQFFARGMRVMSDLPYDDQMVRCIVPDDVLMRQYVENKRKESEQGLQERERREREAQREWTPEQLGQTTWAMALGASAMGMDPTMDIGPAVYELAQAKKKEYDLGAANITGLGRLLRDLGIIKDRGQERKSAQPERRNMMTEREREKIVKEKIDKLAKKIDWHMGAPQLVHWGFTNGQMVLHFGDSRTTLSLEDLKSRYEWLRKEFYEQVKGSFVR